MNDLGLKNKVILFSALDWGFGHTTRCVSLIQHLLAHSNQIIFAGNTTQIAFIKKEFPLVKTEFIKGYNIRLSSKKSTYVQILNQLFKIYNAIKKEQKWVENFITKHSVNVIISDNRYGFRNPAIKSIFMGHQLNIYVPNFRKFVNKKLSKYVNRFDKCWIVDDKQHHLAGDLSNPMYLTIPFEYIGLLNRFKPKQQNLTYDYLVIVSGAEPENTIFLKEVELLFKITNQNIAIVSTTTSDNNIKNATYFYYPTTKELDQLISQSKIVISKAGYTTLMEMVALNKLCYLIPTKGQYEQQYLSTINNKIDNICFIKDLSQIKKGIE
ncbi:MAG TPA: hypothetical protein EYG85_12130 [Crocinitomix sp.]|nr:hypothetical protein [Crocinitomix sp.]